MTSDDTEVFIGDDGAGSGTHKAAMQKAAETTQLADRHAGTTIGDGIEPPYPPHRLAALQELNGTHQVAVGKKAKREVGFGFEIVPHERADDPADAERDEAEAFWFGRESVWKIGPRGTMAASPTEVFELARQDWHGIGWLCIECIYGADDSLQGLAHVPADEVRVRKADTAGGQVRAGHGYVQKNDGETVYYGEAGDRSSGENESATYVDQQNGTTHDSLDDVADPANELIFIPNPSPLSKYYGIPDWVAAIQTMVADQEAKRFNREFFEWDAMGQYFVIVENGKLDDDSREVVTEMIQGMREREGRRVATLESEELVEDKMGDAAPNVNIRVEQIQQHSDEDMAFSEFRMLNEKEVAKVHELPPQLIGRLESSNRGNAKEMVRDFVESYIKPNQQTFAGRLYRIIHQQLLGIDDWTLSFHTHGAEDEKRQAEIAATKIKQAGSALAVNEVREMVGEEPLEGPVGEMLLSELGGGAGAGGGSGGGGSIQQAIEQAVDERVADRLDDRETQQLIDAGAAARADAEAD
jgi:capsid portal protein